MARLPPPDWPLRASGRPVQAAGRDWWLVEMGPPDAPAVLLLHGLGASGHSFRRLAPALAGRFRVIVPDLPGQGFSAGYRPGRCGLDAMAGDLATLCDGMGVAPVAVIGHSAGAALGLRLAERQGLRAVVGINAALGQFRGPAALVFPALARGMARLPFVPPLVTRLWGRPSQVERLLDSTGSRHDEVMARCYLHLIRDPGHVAGALAMMAEWDVAPLLARLPKIACPVLLIAATRDRTVPPAISAEAARRLPRADLHALPGLGHLAQEELPDGLASVIRPWLDTALGD